MKLLRRIIVTQLREVRPLACVVGIDGIDSTCDNCVNVYFGASLVLQFKLGVFCEAT